MQPLIVGSDLISLRLTNNMGIEIRKIISRSTGTKTVQPLFWFYKRSYEKVRISCIFSDALDIDGIITSGKILIYDKDGSNVISEDIPESSIEANNQLVKFFIGGGSVDSSPYTCYCRVATDICERSELKFEMRISEDSVSDTLDEPFEELDLTFEDLDETF